MKNRPADQGFTFLEVMVALAIMSVALVTVIVAQSQSIALVEKGKDISFLTELARRKMAELELEFRGRSLGELREKEKGKFEEEDLADFSWSYEIRKLEIPKGLSNQLSDQAGGKGNVGMGAVADILGKSISQLELTVVWGDEKKGRTVSVTTFLTDSSALPKLSSGKKPAAGG